MQKTVVIQNAIGPRCITIEHGEDIYNEIHPVLTAGGEVTLDFSGVIACTALFFNRAIGLLYQDIPAVELERLLKIEGINKVGEMTLTSVIRTSKEYHTDAKYRAIVDSVMEHMAEELC